MRYSRCMQAGKQLTNLKTIVHTQLSKHLVYELGETLYSGPPTKEAEENHVSPSVLASSPADFVRESQPDVWVTCPEQDLTHANTLHISVSPQIPSKNCLVTNELSLLTPSKNHFPKVFPTHLGLEEYSNDIDGPLVNDRAVNNSSTLLDSHNGTRDLSDPPRVACVKGPNPIRRSPSPAEVNLAMVRLIQEPKTKADPLSLRRASRLPPKRGSSVDCIDSGATRTNQLSQKELRSRRVSCCPSDHVTFEAVEDSGKNTASTRRPRNGDSFADEHPLSGTKLNGDVTIGVNGLTSKPVKARRGSRTSSDDSEVVSWCSQKTNGVVEPVDNDRVDINLLLEISAKDRKRFESKKAKIKRKCADWMLITETEQYYNEKEEILRIKSREEEESDEEELSESDSSEVSTVDENGGQNIRRPPTDKKNPVDDQVDKSRSAPLKKDTLSKKRPTKPHKKESPKNDNDSASSKKFRVRSRATRNVKELSTLEEDDILFTETGSHSLKGKGKALSDKDKNSKPRKRLSDAERFLRDNREYYQFPETRERLRRNASSSTKDHQEDLSIVKVERVVESPVRDKCQPALVDPVTISSTIVSKNHKKKANKCSGKETKETSETRPEVSEPQLECITKSTVALNDDPKPPPILNETLDNLYFSFEGAPIQETWYQTYQRFIDGLQNSAFVYPREPLQFILPYEMPKEYFKDLCAKKTFLCKRKGELSDLVRKSPRCHASTLALFSNIFPSKKKKKAQSSRATRTDEISSDGTSTPVPETSSVKRPLVSDMFETEEELLFIGECMDRIMKSALEEDLSCHSMAESIAARELRKSSSKRRAKGKKANAPPKRPDKVEIPLDSKVFDNPLAVEVDSQFLLGLPRYLEEVSLVPEDTFCKSSIDLLNESCSCGCTEPISCDEASSVDERTEVSSESISLCDSETVDSLNSNSSLKMRKSGPPFKKRRKNLTGWPTRKKRRPAPPPSTTPSNPLPLDDNDNTSFGFDDHETSKTLKKGTKPLNRTRVQTRRPFTELLEPCSDLNLHALGHDRRASPRKRSSVLYMETWPLRFRHHK